MGTKDLSFIDLCTEYKISPWVVDVQQKVDCIVMLCSMTKHKVTSPKLLAGLLSVFGEDGDELTHRSLPPMAICTTRLGTKPQHIGVEVGVCLTTVLVATHNFYPYPSMPRIRAWAI